MDYEEKCDGGYYMPVLCNTNIQSLAAFCAGPIRYSWNNDLFWSPKRSYLRLRAQLKGGAGGVLTAQYGVAPAMNFGDCLYNEMRFYIDGKEVSSCKNHVPQIGALKKRIKKSQGTLSKLEASTNFCEVYHADRVKKVISNSNDVSFEFQNMGKNSTNIASTIQIAAADGVVTGANTTFLSKLFVGDFIVIAGIPYRVISVTTNTAAVVTPRPTGDIAATANYYILSAKDKLFANNFEICHQPALGIFDVDAWMPPGNYQLELNPWNSTSIQNIAVESNSSGMVPGAVDTTSYKLDIIDMILYLWVKDKDFVQNSATEISFEDTVCQMKSILSISATDKQFSLQNSKTKGLTIAFQDKDVLTLSSLSPSFFKVFLNRQNDLTQYQINFAGRSLPISLPSLTKDDANLIDYTTKHYFDNIMNQYNKNYEIHESIEEWQYAGIYFHYEEWPRKQGDQSQTISVRTQFSGAEFTADTIPNLLLFEHYPVKVKLDVANGRVKSVSLD